VLMTEIKLSFGNDRHDGRLQREVLR
jgi:hypothetical protein